MLRPQTSGGDTYCVPYVCVSMSVSVSVIVFVREWESFAARPRLAGCGSESGSGTLSAKLEWEMRAGRKLREKKGIATEIETATNV